MKGTDVGAVIMLGTLFGLIALVFGLVLRFDPRRSGASDEAPEPDDAPMARPVLRHRQRHRVSRASGSI